MVERTLRRRIILISLENRKSQTLINIIKKYVHPESFIYTDCWKGYSDIKKEFASHKTVNLSATFVDFINNVHTNTIEGNWSVIKQSLPVQYRTKDRILKYLILFILKREHNDNIFKEVIKLLL